MLIGYCYYYNFGESDISVLRKTTAYKQQVVIETCDENPEMFAHIL